MVGEGCRGVFGRLGWKMLGYLMVWGKRGLGDSWGWWSWGR